MYRLIFFLIAFSFGSGATLDLIAADACRISPVRAPQGDVARLTCTVEVVSARMGERTIPMFKQANGNWLGLMPIAATDAPGAAQITFLSQFHQEVHTAELTIADAHFKAQNVNLAPDIANLHNSPEEIDLLKAFRANVTDVRYWPDRFVPPVQGCMISPFGVKRFRNHKPTGDYHGGVDLRSPAGTPVQAAADGTVKLARLITVLGNTVGLDHGQGVETIYMHMSRLAVDPGAPVKNGDVIGYVGTTGRSSGPHLHWTVYVNGVQVNPAQWVKLSPCTR
jgi:murein DD-endopeptidase MepM/ murein hydrolase activator NlpD